MRGDIRVLGNDAYIDLGGGKETAVEVIDLPRVNQHSWYYSPKSGRKTKEYVQGTINGHTIYLHRFVMNARKEEEIDHKDHDGLNNRRKNLRSVTHSVNLHNASGSQKNSKTGVLGVHPEVTQTGMRYVAAVEKDGRQKRKLFPYSEEGLVEAKEYVERIRAIAINDPDLWSKLFGPKPQIICRACGERRKHKAHGLCRPCYNHDYERTRRTSRHSTSSS